MRIFKRTKRIVIVIGLIMGALWMPSLADEAKNVEQGKIVELIDPLGNLRMRMRGDAIRKLREIPSATGSLCEVFKSHESVEIRLRADHRLKICAEGKYMPDGAFPDTHPDIAVVGGLATFKQSKVASPTEIKNQRLDSRTLLWHGRFFPQNREFATFPDPNPLDYGD